MPPSATTETKKKAKKKAGPELVKDEKKANGKANGVAAAFPGAGAEAEQEETAGYTPPEPSQDELALADDVFRELVERGPELGDQKVIDKLIAIVDVHTQLRTPENLFASSGADDEKFELAPSLNELVRLLCRGCAKLEVNPGKVVCYWKDHERWTSHGQKVHGKVKRFDGFLQHHLEGMLAALQINYHLYRTYNPRQKVFTIYRLLREVDADGSKRAPDYTGYFEEPGLFGIGVHEEHCRIARAFIRDAQEHVGDPHQLSLASGIFED